MNEKSQDKKGEKIVGERRGRDAELKKNVERKLENMEKKKSNSEICTT